MARDVGSNPFDLHRVGEVYADGTHDRFDRDRLPIVVVRSGSFELLIDGVLAESEATKG